MPRKQNILSPFLKEVTVCSADFFVSTIFTDSYIRLHPRYFISYSRIVIVLLSILARLFFKLGKIHKFQRYILNNEETVMYTVQIYVGKNLQALEPANYPLIFKNISVSPENPKVIPARIVKTQSLRHPLHKSDGTPLSYPKLRSY